MTSLVWVPEVFIGRVHPPPPSLRTEQHPPAWSVVEWHYTRYSGIVAAHSSARAFPSDAASPTTTRSSSKARPPGA